MNIQNNLYKDIENVLKSNNKLKITFEPVAQPKSVEESVNEIVKKSFAKEQKLKFIFKIILTAILIILLFFQLIAITSVTFYIAIKIINYSNSAVTDMRVSLLSSYYSFLKYFVTITLGEFISAFYFILKWGFDDSLSKRLIKLNDK